MKKIVKSNKIYLKPDEKLLERIENNLTYEVFDPHTKSPIPRLIKHYGLVGRGTYWIPNTREDLLQGYEYEVADKRISLNETYPEPSFKLRPDQEDIAKDFLESGLECALINAKPGFGKTILAVYLAYALGEKCLVVCTTTTIRDMWIREVRKWLDMEPGIIGSGTFDHDSPITIANIQTVNKHGIKLAAEFGLLIIDECFDYETYITLADGSKRKIGTIVNKKETPLVRSYNEKSGVWENKRVVRHFKHKQEKLLKLSNKNGSVKCTPNHNMYVWEDSKIIKKQAKDCVVGTKLISDIRHKDSRSIKDWGLLIALTLGDGNLDKTKEGIRLRITHGYKQLNYLECKAEYIGEYTITEGKSGYCDNKVFTYQSPTFKDEIGLYDMLYSNGSKKHLPEEIMEYIDWRTLAYLVMDDGGFSNGNIILSLCEMDKKSLHRLASKFFTDKEYTVYTCNKGYNYLRILVKGVKKLIKNAEREIHPDLRYKFGLNDSCDMYDPTGDTIFHNFTTFEISNIEEVNATGGYRYNIEVEDNHNYVANGKLVSNCHHSPASTFDKLLMESRAKYKIGLSGTIKRKDGLECLFKDYFGFKIFQPEVANTIPPTINMFDTEIEMSGNQMIPWAHKVNQVLENPRYRGIVTALTNSYVAMGHKVIVVSDRVSFLKYINENVSCRSELFIGETTTDERETLQQRMTDGHIDVFCASQNIFSEGVSQDNLSCMILASPIGDNESLLEQLAGRIMRKSEGKLDPVLVDLKLDGWTGTRHRRARLGVYLKNNWEVVPMTLQQLIRSNEKAIAKLVNFKV